MSSATAVRTTLPFPATIAAFPCGMAWLAHPTCARPTRKTTSMLLTVTSPATPACGARAPVTDKIVRTCTSAAAELGLVTQVEQADATTDGAAGGTGVTTGTGGPLELAAPGPPLHPARPTTVTAAARNVRMPGGSDRLRSWLPSARSVCSAGRRLLPIPATWMRPAPSGP